MTYPLAIFAPVIGGRTETFIRRHILELLPTGTVVVADTCDGPYGGHWNVDCPLLVLRNIRSGRFRAQIARAFARGSNGHPRQYLLKNVRRFLRQQRVEVIMGEYLDWSLAWFGLAQELGIRFYAHAHGYDVSMQLRDPKWRSAYLTYKQSAGIITMSEFSRANLINLGLDAAKIHVIPYGVDVPATPLNRTEQETVRCLTAGRMVAKKAPILTLDAFRRAALAFPKLHLDYVGAGELLPAAQQFVRAFNLHDRVTLHGGQSSEYVRDLMEKADVFLQHSMTDPDTGDEEGLPVAILEAMACGMPVVSTRHTGIPEAVLDGKTGYLVEEGDSIAMADCLVTLARDAELRSQMGAAGWRRAKQHFSWERERVGLLGVLGLEAENRRAVIRS